MRLPWRRKAEPERPAVPADWIAAQRWIAWEAPRNYVAGEHSYRRALAKLAGPTCEDGYCLATEVVFVREQGNAYDPTAEVRGQHIGYLRRHPAAQVAGSLDRVRSFAVCGLIHGGSTDAPNLGVHVWLDRVLTPGVALNLPPDDEWSVPWPPHDRELEPRAA
jgi:hypothetical protein